MLLWLVYLVFALLNLAFGLWASDSVILVPRNAYFFVSGYLTAAFWVSFCRWYFTPHHTRYEV